MLPVGDSHIFHQRFQFSFFTSFLGGEEECQGGLGDALGTGQSCFLGCVMSRRCISKVMQQAHEATKLQSDYKIPCTSASESD